VGLSSRAAYVSYAPSILVGFAVLILSLARNERPIAGLFGNPVMHYLGRISYSVYLVHWLVLTNVPVENWLTIPEGTLTVVRILSVIVAAVLLHHLIEQPSRRRLRRMFVQKT
jgi:peptidoglycan/LPS O-acetylase OafA/YrhL